MSIQINKNLPKNSIYVFCAGTAVETFAKTNADKNK